MGDKMKKRIVVPVFALAISIAGYFFGFDNLINSKSNQQLEEKIPQKLQEVQKEGMAPNKYINAFVVKVTDGDTFEATYKGESHKVRLLCVDTPESVKQGVEPQPYSKDASDFTKQTLLNQSVKLIFDKEIRDRYGRLLAYAVLKEDIFFNAELVKKGYARVEIVSPNSSLKDYFYSLQETAVKEKVGFWALPKGKQPFVLDEKGKYVPVYK